jgi:hypothetical protein
MAKRLKVTLTVEDDILDRPRDLHRHATVERSHYQSRPVRERRDQRDHGAAQEAGVVRLSPGTSARRERSNGGEEAWVLGEGCAMSRDFKQIEREIAQAARRAAKWRMLQNEALEVAGAMEHAVYCGGL